MERNGNPIEQLDKVLSFMVTSWATTGRIESVRIKTELEKTGYVIDSGDLHDVINQLLEDKYIEGKEFTESINNTKYFTYRATWAGKYFQMTLGYQKKIDRERKEKIDVENLQAYNLKQADRLEKIQIRNLVLTLILASTATILCVIEVIKFLETHPHLFCFGH